MDRVARDHDALMMAATRSHGIGAAVSVVGLVTAAFVVAPDPVGGGRHRHDDQHDGDRLRAGERRQDAKASVTLTNTGGDPFGPINIFGGAPPTAEFNASQNCQGTTLPAGGSCMVNYSFSPG